MKLNFFLRLISFCFFVLIIALPSMGYSEIKNTPEGVIITHYPEKFDVRGKIDRIDQYGIVVQDRYFRFSSDIRFMTPRLTYATRSAFKSGENVGFVLDEKRRIAVLCTIYEDN